MENDNEIEPALTPHDEFRMMLGNYYKVERDRSEKCLGDIVNILDNAENEETQLRAILDRLTSHYAR